jgi:hypothetical protein
LVCLIYLLTFLCLLGDSKQHSKYKRNFEDILNRTKDFEDILNRTKDISVSLRWVIRLSVIYHGMSLTVLYISVIKM